MNSIPFNNLKPIHQQIASEIEAAVQRVLQSGWFILGPEVESFEQAFADYHQVKYAVSVANGTDAIELALRASDIGVGDEVITVSHTAMPTVTAIEATGATPVLVDIDSNTYTIDPAAVEATITGRSRAIVPVHLYGQTADMEPLIKIAQRHSLLVLEDCAQSHGARYRGQLAGTLGHMAAFSFYPTKNLGAYGDGGAIITNDEHFADKLRRLRFYGQSSRYKHIERGTNSRLDEIQAAILSVKLKYLDEHNRERQRLANIYSSSLVGVECPVVREETAHVFHLYVIRYTQRDLLMEKLKQQQIGTLVHYPIPIHMQQSHIDLGYRLGSLPNTEQAAQEILSLPLYIGLDSDAIQYVSDAIKASIQ